MRWLIGSLAHMVLDLWDLWDDALPTLHRFPLPSGKLT